MLNVKECSCSCEISCSATNVNFDKLCYETRDPPLSDFAMPDGGLHLRLRDDWISQVSCSCAVMAESQQDVRMYKHKLKAVEAFAHHNKWDKVQAAGRRRNVMMPPGGVG